MEEMVLMMKEAIREEFKELKEGLKEVKEGLKNLKKNSLFTDLLIIYAIYLFKNRSLEVLHITK